MLSIEKAFEPFGSLNRRMGKANAQAAARALAESVLEEAYLMYCGYDPEFKADETAALDYAVIRARIKALGK